MYFRSALLLALACGTVSAQTIAADPDRINGPVTIFLNGSSASAAVVATAKREVESALRASSIRVAWLSAEALNRTDVYNRMAIVEMVGDCRPDAPIRLVPVPGRRDADALGETPIADGRVLPFAYVLCDPIRKLIHPDLVTASSDDRDELLGRAIGRVMAHELYHVLLQTTKHGRQGLAKPAQSRGDLICDHSTFAEAEERKLADITSPGDGESESSTAFVTAGR